MALRLLSNAIDPTDRADWWQSVVMTGLGKSEVVHQDLRALRCEIDARPAGDLVLVDSTCTPFVGDRRRQHILADDKDSLSIGFLRSGSGLLEQDDRRVRRGVGTIVVSDATRPYSFIQETNHRHFGFRLPRERLERAFGSSKRFTMLPIDTAMGSAPICAYLTALYDNLDKLSPETAAEMAGVGVELVIGALARRLAQEPALPQSTALMLYRARRFIDQHVGDPDLSSTLVASALGVSLRHLQALFKRSGTTPSDWIWTRRLEVARHRLSTADGAALSVGEIAYGCGFADQAHFSRRFRAAFGVTPGEWRHNALGSVYQRDGGVHGFQRIAAIR